MNHRHSRTRSRQRIFRIVWLLLVVVVAAAVIYLNIRRKYNLEMVMARRVLLQEQMENDPRFREVTIGIDAATGYSLASGTVASEEDLAALKKMISKIRPFPGTYGWRNGVEIKTSPAARGIPEAH